MSEITLDNELKQRLKGLNESVVLRDESGAAIGMVLPISDYKQLLKHVDIPFNDDEISERRRIKEGMELQEFWQKMGQS